MTQYDEAIIRELLEAVSKLPKDKEFNTFKVLEIYKKEVIMCRFLTMLLDSSGEHGHGRLFVDLFFDMVLKIEKPSSSIKAMKEKVIETKRRIDIVLEYDDVVLPIEVKILASEQKDQCADYVKHAKNSLLYYLTIDGDEPDDYESFQDKIQCISWKLIHEWLLECINQVNTAAESNAYFYDLLCQYAKAVKDFTEDDDAVMGVIKSNLKYESAAGKISMASFYLREENQEIDQPDIINIIEVIQSSPNFTEAAKRISEAYMLPQIKSTPMEKLDKKLQDEHGFKVYHQTRLHKTYYTTKENVFLRLQYKSSKSLEPVVCFIVDNGKFKFAGLNGKWAFEEISDNKDFDLLYEDEYLSSCIAKIVKKLDELK
ncbi:MAG: PD-(D/E)XK nuclease family protein [Defluviitaleaceae bacterium]|nr:PD-(D/E)XK nuclease family protein [Defluviitaleaceae bacterium]